MGSGEGSGAFLEDSTRRLDANAHRCYSQFMFLFKPMSRAADAGSSRQGLGVRGNRAHTLQGFPQADGCMLQTVKQNEQLTASVWGQSPELGA